MLCDVSIGNEAFLIRMEFINSPGGEAGINQISIHFTIGVHGGDRAVVSY